MPVELATTIAAALGVAWASGINLYAAVFVLGWMANAGSIDLPPDLQVIESPAVMLAAGVMYVVEFFADKVPGLDTLWDAVHSFIRIPVGALLAAGAISPLGPEVEILGLILGGTLTAGSHFTKAGTRVLINTSPEPVSNWTASIGEDIMVVAGLWTAMNHPILFIVLMILFVALVIWLLPKLWRAIKSVFRRIKRFFSAPEPPITAAADESGTRIPDQRDSP